MWTSRPRQLRKPQENYQVKKLRKLDLKIYFVKNPLLIFRHSPEPEEGGAGPGDDEQNAGYRFGEQLVFQFPANF
jgi:hypothetical protein